LLAADVAHSHTDGHDLVPADPAAVLIDHLVAVRADGRHSFTNEPYFSLITHVRLHKYPQAGLAISKAGDVFRRWYAYAHDYFWASSLSIPSSRAKMLPKPSSI
jgi:hypothetical protein